MSRERFDALDGLRGVAAIAVTIMHASHISWYFARNPTTFPGALAVDFFFMLSGFVLAHAYAARLDGGLGTWPYMRARLIRLYPLIPLGILLDAAVLSLLGKDVGGWVIPALLLLPTGKLEGMPSFILDPPVWSLAFEILASLLVATRLRRMGRRATLAWLLLFGIADVAAWLSDLPRDAQLLAAIPRTGFAFVLGFAVYRSELWRRVPTLPWWLVGAGLFTVLIAPPLVSPVMASVTLLSLPLFLLLAARAPAGGAARVLGELSYPLYILHFPVMRLVIPVTATMTRDPVVLMVVGTIVSGICAWLALKLYDEPMRRWLSAWVTRRGPVTPIRPLAATPGRGRVVDIP